MMRISLLLLAISGCAIDPDSDQLVFCGSHCDDDLGDHGTPPPPETFTFLADGYSGAERLAVGGTLQVEVDALPLQVPQVTASGTAFSLAVISAEPHRTMTELTGFAVGEGTLTATVQHVDKPGTLVVEVGELSTIEAAIGTFESETSDSLVVLPDIREISLRLAAADGGPLIDHSLAIDASSDPGFTQTKWDTIRLPAEPGDRVLALTRKAGDLHHIGVRTVDHVDAIVADHLDAGTTSGDLCVHAEVDGEVVATHASSWTYRATNVEFAPHGNCIAFFRAMPGATITAELAGTTADFAILP